MDPLAELGLDWFEQIVQYLFEAVGDLREI
jgi:hypothetical protein